MKALTHESSDAHLVMLEQATGKLVTGCHAPTLASLYSWLKRHPTFEVVQSAPTAGRSMYQSQCSVCCYRMVSSLGNIIIKNHGRLRMIIG